MLEKALLSWRTSTVLLRGSIAFAILIVGLFLSQVAYDGLVWAVVNKPQAVETALIVTMMAGASMLIASLDILEP